MQIKELMQKLGELHPDTEVTISDKFSPSMLEKTKTAELIEVKRHTENAYYICADLDRGGYGGIGAFVQPYQSKIKKRPTQIVLVIR